MADEHSGGFLPPEPAGPEPEIEGRPASGPQAPPPGPGYVPPAAGQAYGAAPPAPGYQPPPGAGWGPPPGQGWQQAPPPWGYPQPPVPDNTPAVAGFVLSLVSVGLLLFSAGLSSIISVGCSIAAIVLGRKGIKKVDAGETPKQKSLAQAAFWIGIAGLVLSVLASLAWIAIVIAIAVDEDTRRDFENEFDESRSIAALIAPALRVMAQFLT
ncbi:MAG TPA: hypothetical protein VHJ37_08710 [Thermoleophilaceae bacterium]|nr:hypothetical protein [Thermoleophilaceae bacterium]